MNGRKNALKTNTTNPDYPYVLQRPYTHLTGGRKSTTSPPFIPSSSPAGYHQILCLSSKFTWRTFRPFNTQYTCLLWHYGFFCLYVSSNLPPPAYLGNPLRIPPSKPLQTIHLPLSFSTTQWCLPESGPFFRLWWYCTDTSFQEYVFSARSPPLSRFTSMNAFLSQRPVLPISSFFPVCSHKTHYGFFSVNVAVCFGHGPSRRAASRKPAACISKNRPRLHLKSDGGPSRMPFYREFCYECPLEETLLVLLERCCNYPENSL